MAYFSLLTHELWEQYGKVKEGYYLQVVVSRSKSPVANNPNAEWH